MTSERILQLRQHLNLTQHQFAELVGSNRHTVLRWERGLSVPLQIFQDKLLELEKEHGSNP